MNWLTLCSIWRMHDVATTTVSTTITPEAHALAKQFGVERELEAILEQGRQTVRGLLSLDVCAEGPHDMGESCIVVTARIDPTFENDPTHIEWWGWRVETFGVDIALHFLVCFSITGT